MSASSRRRLPIAGVALCAIVALTAACGGSSGPAKNNAAAKKNIKLVDSTPAGHRPARQGHLAHAQGARQPRPHQRPGERPVRPGHDERLRAAEQAEPRHERRAGPRLEVQWKTPTNAGLHPARQREVPRRRADDGGRRGVEHEAERHRGQRRVGRVRERDVRSRKTGPHEITFTLKQSDAVFVEALAGDAGVVQERKVVEAQGKAFGTPSGTDACSGPLTVKEWQSGQRRRAAPRLDDYWDTAKASKVGEITFKWADDDAIVNSLLTGSAQGAYLENIASAARLDQERHHDGEPGPRHPGVEPARHRARRAGRPRMSVRRCRSRSTATASTGPRSPDWASRGRSRSAPVPGAMRSRPSRRRTTSSPDHRPSRTAGDIAAAKKLVAAAGATKPIVVASDGSSARNTLANALVDAAQKIGLKATITQIPTAQYGDFYDNPGPAQERRPVLRRLLHLQDRPGRLLQERRLRVPRSSGCSRTRPTTSWCSTAARPSTPPARATIAIELAKRWADAKPWISAVLSPNTVVAVLEGDGRAGLRLGPLLPVGGRPGHEGIRVRRCCGGSVRWS